MGERVRWRLAANVGVVMGLFASVLALAAVAAPEARADGGTCTKAAAGDGVSLTIDGFAAEDSAAVRRNGKWVTTIDDLAVPVSASGSVDDDWKLRVRGPGQPDPYLEVTCAAAPVGGAATCTIVDDGSLRAEFAGFGANDALNLRRNGKWVATADGAVTSIDDLPGTADDTWTLRARGADFEEPYSTIECDTGDVEPPPPPADSFCRVTDAGLEWDDAGVDQYQVRRNGKWVATATERTYPTEDLEADWIIRYRIGGERIDQTCEPGEVEPGPCMLEGAVVDSIMNADQCRFAAAMLPGLATDPCERFQFFCEDGVVKGIELENGVLPDGLRFFPDLTSLVFGFGDYGLIPAELGTLQSLERLSVSEASVEFPAEVGLLQNLAIFAAEFESDIVLPDEFGTLEQLRSVNLSSTTAMTQLPDPVLDLPNLEVLDISLSEIAAIPELNGRGQALRVLDAFESQLTSLPSGLFDLPNLRSVDVSGSPIGAMPIAQNGAPDGLVISAFGIPLQGDQTEWLVALGDPVAKGLSVELEWFGACPVWTTDATWDAFLTDTVEGWDGCRPPA